MHKEFKPRRDFDLQKKHFRKIGGERYQNFLDAGYGEWVQPIHPLDRKILLQKAICDGSQQKLYFINIWVSDFSMYDTCQSYVMFSAGVQFNIQSKDKICFNTSFTIDDTKTVEDVEKFFADIYQKLNCEPRVD